jgi:putative transposon-encoded protein
LPPKRQFHTSAQKRTFFDRRVLRYGSSATVSMGKIIPKNWAHVRVSIVDQTERTLTIKMERLEVRLASAYNTENDKTNRHNP